MFKVKSEPLQLVVVLKYTQNNILTMKCGHLGNENDMVATQDYFMSIKAFIL